MSASTVPAAIDALVAKFTTVAVSGFAVYDGPPAGADGQTTAAADDYVAVAISDDDDPAVAGGQDDEDGSPLAWGEAYTVRCQISSWSGTGTMKARRDRAHAQYTACETAVRGDPTLGAFAGNGLARISDWSAISAQTLKGPVYTINFGVTIHADRM